MRAARDALAVAALVEPITTSLAEQGMAELYEQIENPLVVVLARMEHVGIAVDRGFLEAAVPEAHRRRRPARRGGAHDLRARRPQRQLDDPAAADPVHRTGADAGQEDEDGGVDGRLVAREAAGPVAGVHRPAVAVPRGREAARHVRRGVAPRGRRRRPHPRNVQPDGRPHRAAQLGPSEPAQHPGPT